MPVEKPVENQSILRIFLSNFQSVQNLGKQFSSYIRAVLPSYTNGRQSRSAGVGEGLRTKIFLSALKKTTLVHLTESPFPLNNPLIPFKRSVYTRERDLELYRSLNTDRLTECNQISSFLFPKRSIKRESKHLSYNRTLNYCLSTSVIIRSLNNLILDLLTVCITTGLRAALSPLRSVFGNGNRGKIYQTLVHLQVYGGFSLEGNVCKSERCRNV